MTLGVPYNKAMASFGWATDCFCRQPKIGTRWRQKQPRMRSVKQKQHLCNIETTENMTNYL